ncbi:MAG: LemA family protein [Fimbriimonadaceae bacterium]|jgi:LemA protein|nr:LemA family protein [Fimbriimonadaceae bacterium]MCE2767876.1 LemA family protein [Fimbriimonadaceae bacterium]
MLIYAVLLIIPLLVVFGLISMYNGLVAMRRDCDNALSQIDVQLKRRYDLIPNLVETVKGYMKFESETLEKVIQARNLALGARTVSEKSNADAAVTSALNGFFAVSEAYPDLKSSSNMLSLQEELKSTENKVSFARQYYNDSVTRLNTKIEQFPSSILAGMGGFKAKELFVLEEPEARQAVKVQF